MKRHLIGSILLLSLAPSAHSVVYVSNSAPGPSHDGTSWATAFPTVTAGITAAVPGDEVWVAAGTYGESLILPNGVALYGGFAGTESSRDQRDPVKVTSILDGGGTVRPLTIAADADSRTIVDGFTIQNGYHFDANAGGRGAGVYISGGTPILSNNVIRNCFAVGNRSIYSVGGGVYIAGGTPLIAGNTITGNKAAMGAGIYAPSGFVRDNVISANQSGPSYGGVGNGGGIYMGDGAVAVRNTLQANVADSVSGGGGGIECFGGTVIGNHLVDNVHAYSGAALHCFGTCTILRNLITDYRTDQGSEVGFSGGTFSDNLLVTASSNPGLAVGDGGASDIHPLITNNTIVRVGTIPASGLAVGVYSGYRSGQQPVLSNNIITGWLKATDATTGGTAPTFTVDHNDSYGNADNALNLPGGSPLWTSGNFSLDPYFVNPGAGDYHLKAISPCIDAGNDATVKSGDRDADGAQRIAGAHVDIGAYEYGSPAYTMQDAATVLKVAARLSTSAPADLSRLDVAGEKGLTVTDATRIAQWLLN